LGRICGKRGFGLQAEVFCIQIYGPKHGDVMIFPLADLHLVERLRQGHQCWD